MSVVFTIGYEGTDIDRFMATLRAAGVQQVADVRAVPLSRKRGFSKKSLAARLEAEGLLYLPFSGLGDPKPGREAARAGHYDRFRAIYGAHLQAEAAQNEMTQLVALACARATALLCFERDPATCHRSIVAAELGSRGFEVCDLYGDEPERYARNAARLPRHHPCQSVAAA
ncbi:MAG TPA: DUF488 domain-containing protein [Mesorhizobium sp.]|jgi:uncharacterized protein (DUF488 family)|nr:DUF488 domain-containing protein [Mesorhizobium sp.]